MYFASCKSCVIRASLSFPYAFLFHTNFVLSIGSRGNMSDQGYSSPFGRMERDTRPGGWLALEVGLSWFA